MSEIALVPSNRSSHLRIVYSQKTFKRKELLRLKPGTFWKIETGVVRSLSWDEDGRIWRVNLSRNVTKFSSHSSRYGRCDRQHPIFVKRLFFLLTPDSFLLTSA